MDGMRTCKELNCSSIGHLHVHVVESAHFCILISHPFVGRNRIQMPALDHKRPGRHQICEIGVVYDIGKIQTFVLHICTRQMC